MIGIVIAFTGSVYRAAKLNEAEYAVRKFTAFLRLWTRTELFMWEVNVGNHCCTS